MDFNEYKNTMKFPTCPSKPKKKDGQSNAEYGVLLDAWETKKSSFLKEKYDYKNHDRVLFKKFKKDLIEELGWWNLPESIQESLFSYSWERGHSNGYSEVYNIAVDLDDSVVHAFRMKILFDKAKR